MTKVINGRCGVSEKTNKKVQQALNQTDFMAKIGVNHTNYIAVNYSTQKSDIFESYLRKKCLKKGKKLPRLSLTYYPANWFALKTQKILFLKRNW